MPGATSSFLLLVAVPGVQDVVQPFSLSEAIKDLTQTVDDDFVGVLPNPKEELEAARQRLNIKPVPGPPGSIVTGLFGTPSSRWCGAGHGTATVSICS